MVISISGFRKGAEPQANRWLLSLVTDITAINTQTNLSPGRIRAPEYGFFRNSPFRARGRQHVPRHAPAHEAGAVERKRRLYCLYPRSGRRRWPRGHHLFRMDLDTGNADQSDQWRNRVQVRGVDNQKIGVCLVWNRGGGLVSRVVRAGDRFVASAVTTSSANRRFRRREALT